VVFDQIPYINDTVTVDVNSDRPSISEEYLAALTDAIGLAPDSRFHRVRVYEEHPGRRAQKAFQKFSAIEHVPSADHILD
jgi:hypothetical protein